MPDLRVLRLEDFDAARGLYAALFEDNAVGDRSAFAQLIAHPGTQIIGAFSGETLAGMATLHVLPNMTYGGQPYAIIENVVTKADMRGRSIGQMVVQATIDAAWAAGCYKIMLQTGRARGASAFYEKLGFNADEKHAMILRRLPPSPPVERPS